MLRPAFNFQVSSARDSNSNLRTPISDAFPTCDQSHSSQIRCIHLRRAAFATLRRANGYGVIEIPQLGSQIPGVASSIMCPSGSRKYKLWAPLSQFISLRRPTSCFASRARQKSIVSCEMPNAMCPGPRPFCSGNAHGGRTSPLAVLFGVRAASRLTRSKYR